jgi:hypothetical protein
MRQESSVESEIALEGGCSYLVEEERAQWGYELFRELILAGASGLCMTRTNPRMLEQRIGVPDVRIIWLSDTRVEDYLSTKDLTRLSIEAHDFLMSVKRGVILIDGFEYLCSQHSFEATFGFIQLLRERISTGEHILILSINPGALERKQLMNLRKELRPVER